MSSKNLSAFHFWGGLIAMLIALGTLVYGQASANSRAETMGQEVQTLRTHRENDHTDIVSLRGEIKALREIMERIDRRLTP